MRNLTISIDDETARWARIEAARNDKSVSAYVGDLLRDQMSLAQAYESAHASWRSRDITTLRSQPNTYPDREDLHIR